MPSLKVAEYLFRRLRQLGVDSVHGVPGDFNLTLLDYVEPAGLRWVGNANELNAAYAADGYARIKGIGAVVTTFGVGELSAVNAIAGAYTERAPVVHIVGTPSRELQAGRKLIHHTFNDGEYGRFAKIHAQLTVAQASLRDPRTSPEQIDEVLRQCLLHSRPVYIEVPVDMVDRYVADDRLGVAINQPEVVPSQVQDDVVARIVERIYAAKQPIILVDGEIRPLGIVEEVQKLVDATNWPTWTTVFGKGLLDETKANFHGIYQGTYDTAAVQQFFNAADLVLCFGPHFSSTNSYFYSIIPKPESAILFTDTEVQFGTDIVRDLPAKLITSRLVQSLDLSQTYRYDPYPSLPHDQRLSFSDVDSSQSITQDKLWRLLANFLRPGDIILGETGTAGYGVREMALPPHTRVFAPVTWLSIGYMLPGAQGAALAQEELIAASKYHGINDARTILLIGDGSFQMTAQELATIINHKLNVVVFLINNDGYTIERCIHGRKQRYNDVPRWRYLQAPSFFGASEDAYTGTARTWGELEDVLANDVVSNGKELRMVEVFMDREDAPTGPLSMLIQKQQATDGL
ncbi:alpha-keto acid decarboxylase family protein [Aspergillus ibericus CBS 121593]|uniref:Pyruvate decarboxylase n=1 Tax=Aspergillus ibericus CBS 121593 TaxID=1448316 RepID=A0A395GW67_9EURO|nr:thiamine pyrophosphate enzyme [Aspergillus ibericus CBS 121593]RAK99609.1 thiamine pyrophosphate enzyme [Aspergillus ibericus CBS 121593]